MQEIWKDINGYEGIYKVSNLGNVKSLDRKAWNGKTWHNHKGRILKNILSKQTKTQKKYYEVKLSKNGKAKKYNIHQLMAETFLDPYYVKKGLVCDHIDNDSKNNRLDNLQIITQRENSSKDRIGKSIYSGVFIDNGKIRMCIQVKGQREYYSGFKTEKEAFNAYLKRLNEIS